MNNVVKLKADKDYTNLKYWESEEAAGLKYFLNKAVVIRSRLVYNKGMIGSETQGQ